MSVYHNQALKTCMNNNPERTVIFFQISKILFVSRCAEPLNISCRFKKCGISPIDPDVFTNIDFVAAETTNEKQQRVIRTPPSLIYSLQCLINKKISCLTAVRKPILQALSQADNKSLLAHSPTYIAIDTMPVSLEHMGNKLLNTAVCGLPLLPPPQAENIQLEPQPSISSAPDAMHIIKLPGEILSSSPSISPLVVSTTMPSIASTSFDVPSHQIHALPKVIAQRVKITRVRGRAEPLRF